MKITAKMLTNKSLISIVDAAIAAERIPQPILLSHYRYGLISQLKSIRQQLGKIAEKSLDKNLTRKEYQMLCRKERQLVSLGNKKLEILKRLDNAPF